MGMSVEAYIPPKKRLSDKFWKAAAADWHRLYSKYVPMATGTLYQTVRIDANEIHHTQIYAHYQYNGTGFNFRRDQHPLASARWDEAAKPSQMPVLIKDLQAMIDSGDF